MSATPVIRIERGAVTPEELAAVSVVLLARSSAAAETAAVAAAPRSLRVLAGWQRPELVAIHRDPRGWRTAGTPVADRRAA